MMLEKMADLEVLEVVATLDFAHRHIGQAALVPVIVEIVKSPEAESVFYGIRGGASTDGGGRGLERLYFNETRLGFMLPWAGVTPAPGINRKMARTPFCSQARFRCVSVSGDLRASDALACLQARIVFFDAGVR
jgi:hypothetical protein